MTQSIAPQLILVPLDGSDPSFKAAEYGIDLAKLVGAKVIFMHAVVNPPYMDFKGAGLVIVSYIEDAKRHAESWFQIAGEMASNEGVKFASEAILDVASAADSIVRYAESKKVDLIVMGTRGRSGVRRFLLGSVASGVVAHSKCSVLVVR